MKTITRPEKEQELPPSPIELSRRPLSPRKPRYLSEKIFYQSTKKMKKGLLRLVFSQANEYRDLGEGIYDENTPTIVIHNSEAFFKKILRYGELGFGESYVQKIWSSQNLRGVLDWFCQNIKHSPGFSSQKRRGLINFLNILNMLRHRLRRNWVSMSRKNIAEHYDLSNDFFKKMLDPTMAYSSAIFLSKDDSLQEAQENKFRIACEKLNLGPKDHLLEIGTGWGGLAVYAAKNYGCRVTSITISQEQYQYSRELIQNEGLDEKVTIRLKDYRSLEGTYDKIISIEMVEALGYQYFDAFFKKCADVLKEDGLMLIQCITFPEPYYQNYLKNTDFIQKHIFPGSLLLSIHEILNSLQRTSDLMIWDIESIGLHYAQTLARWKKNFWKIWTMWFRWVLMLPL